MCICTLNHLKHLNFERFCIIYILQYQGLVEVVFVNVFYKNTQSYDLSHFLALKFMY